MIPLSVQSLAPHLNYCTNKYDKIWEDYINANANIIEAIKLEVYTDLSYRRARTRVNTNIGS